MILNFLNLINNIFKKFLYFLSKRPTNTIVLGVIILVLVSYFIFSPSQTSEETAVVKVGELKQFVKVTGSVKPSREADLAFQTIGAVSYVNVKVGEVVYQGEVLAGLQSNDVKAGLLQAQAQLESAQATLEQLTQGFRKEEIAIKQQTVDNARNSLEQTYFSLPDTIRNAENTTFDVVKNKLGSLFSTSGYYYNLSFTSCNQALQSSIEMKRTDIEKTLSNFQNESVKISQFSSKEEIDSVFESAYNVTSVTNELISSISNLLLTQCSTQNSALDAYRATLSTVRTTMSTLFSEITTKRSSLNSAKNVLSQANRDLELANAGTDPYKLKSQSALVSQAKAQVAQAEANVQKAIIVAPFSGTISDVSINVGETVSSGKTVITMLANNSFEIEAKIPEIDIVKIKSGAKVEVTLDSYGKAVVFPAVVTRVNPTATLEGSVPIYKVIVTFIAGDERIKSGMTANVNIITENKSKVLILPARFVEMKDEARGTVTIRKNNQNVIQDVLLGIRGEEGMIEILSGLVEGDEVISPAIGTRSAQKQTN